MSNPYVTLSDSEALIVKRFKAIKMATPRQRTDTFKITAGGGVDKSAGVIMHLFYYTFKVPAETSDTNYGTLDDLLDLFELNNPAAGVGNPTDLLTLTDHYGDSHFVKFKEDVAPEPLTTQLEGPNAIHYINVSLIEIPNAGGS